MTESRGTPGSPPPLANSPDQRMPRSSSASEFEYLARRAGLTLTQAQISEMHRAFSVVEAMAARVRTPRGHQAEPAVTFSVKRRDGR